MKNLSAKNKDTQRSRLIAEQAGRAEEVIAFRRDVLAEKLISPDDIETWIERTHEKDEKLCRVPREGRFFHQEDVLRRVKKIFDSGRVCSIKFDNATITTKRHRLHLVHGGVLHRLNDLAAEIGRRYGWEMTQAMRFILSGETPLVPLVSFGVRPNGFHIWAHHSVTPKLLADAYKQARKQYGFKDQRPGRKGFENDDLNRKSVRQKERRHKEKLLTPAVNPHDLFAQLSGWTKTKTKVTMSTNVACKRLSKQLKVKVSRQKLYRMLSAGKIIKRGHDQWELPGAREEALKAALLPQRRQAPVK